MTPPQETKVLAAVNLPEVMRVDKIMRMVYKNLRLDNAYSKSSHCNSSHPSTNTTAPKQKDVHSPPRGSSGRPVVSWTENHFLVNHCRTMPSRLGKGSWKGWKRSPNLLVLFKKLCQVSLAIIRIEYCMQVM